MRASRSSCCSSQRWAASGSTIVRHGSSATTEVGVSFWIGVGFQSDLVFPEHIAGFAGGLLRNGVTAGGITAILMTFFVELTKPRRSRIEAPFDLSVLSTIRDFLAAFATHSGWGDATAARLDAVCEETLLTLIRQEEGDEEREERRLRVVAY